MAGIICPNCGEPMRENDECPWCTHVDGDVECRCAFCWARDEEDVK